MITATVSHEMRTPINAIMMQLENLEILLKGQIEC
jgi:signal transduction histidine kinase